MEYQIKEIKKILIKVYDEECGCNEGSLSKNDLLIIFAYLDEIKQYINMIKK